MPVLITKAYAVGCNRAFDEPGRSRPPEEVRNCKYTTGEEEHSRAEALKQARKLGWAILRTGKTFCPYCKTLPVTKMIIQASRRHAKPRSAKTTH